MLHVGQRGSVITWDFDVLKGDVTFTLLRLQRAYRGQPHQHHVGGSVSSTQFTDKRWLIGRDLHVVEPPSLCHCGDSVQVRRGRGGCSGATCTSSNRRCCATAATVSRYGGSM